MVWHLLGKQAGAIPYRFESCTLRLRLAVARLRRDAVRRRRAKAGVNIFYREAARPYFIQN